MDWAQLANTSASALVVLCSLTFAVVYNLRAPWRMSAVGRHMMVFTCAISLLCLYTVLITALWPTGTPAAVLRALRTAVLFVIALLIIQRTRMVVRAQHHHDPVESEASGAKSSAIRPPKDGTK